VAGGSGFVGSAVVERFLKEPDSRVWVLTRNPERARRLLPEGVELINLSEGWERVSERLKELGPEVVVNSVGILFERESTFEEVHVEFLKRLLEALRGLDLRRFVQISACGVGRASFSRYLTTKEEAERLVRNSGFPYAILRPSIVVGRRQLLFRQLKAVAPFLPVLFVPRTVVQPLSVLDLAEAVFRVSTDEAFKNAVCELGGPRVTTMGELVRRALEYLGYRRWVVELPWWVFVPAAPILKLLGFGDLETVKLARLKNACPEDNCLPKLVGRPRDPFDF